MLLGNESLRHTHPELALQLRMFGSPAAVGSLCPAAQAALAEIWQTTQLLSSLCVCVRACARVLYVRVRCVFGADPMLFFATYATVSGCFTCNM